MDRSSSRKFVPCLTWFADLQRSRLDAQHPALIFRKDGFIPHMDRSLSKMKRRSRLSASYRGERIDGTSLSPGEMAYIYLLITRARHIRSQWQLGKRGAFCEYSMCRQIAKDWL